MHDWSHELHTEANRLADEARRIAGGAPYRRNGGHGRTAGFVLVVLGLLLLSANAGFFNFINWNLFWPVIVIALGLALLARQADWGR